MLHSRETDLRKKGHPSHRHQQEGRQVWEQLLAGLGVGGGRLGRPISRGGGGATFEKKGEGDGLEEQCGLCCVGRPRRQPGQAQGREAGCSALSCLPPEGYFFPLGKIPFGDPSETDYVLKQSPHVTVLRPRVCTSSSDLRSDWLRYCCLLYTSDAGRRQV